MLHLILRLRPKYLYHMLSPPMKRNSKQIGRARPWKLGPHGIAKEAIRKGVRGTMKCSAPHEGANWGDKYCINSRYNITAGVVINSNILPPYCPPNELVKQSPLPGA
jgi:hypothetical protein